MPAKDDRQWIATWTTPPHNLSTLDCREERLDAVLWRDSCAASRSDRVSSDAELIVAASTGRIAAEEVESRVSGLGKSLLLAGRDLACPLELPQIHAPLSSRRWVSLFAAQRGFGGACCVIDCGSEVTIDLVDDDDRMYSTNIEGPLPDETDEYCRAIDREIIALAEGNGVDGPLLVITGDDAKIYIEHGRLPVQPVPDLVHRGLIELLSSSHES